MPAWDTRLIGFGILFAVGVTIGFILLIVPGLILITFWSDGTHPRSTAPAKLEATRQGWSVLYFSAATVADSY